MNRKKTSTLCSNKAKTGIAGFDEITHGGLPRGRTTLIGGGPGSGKTIMALQSLVNGAKHEDEPGIFVAFEENSERIIANAGKFGWDLIQLQKKRLFFLDAQPTPELLQSGGFDLSGMLAGLEAKARDIEARRIVFDALDVVLSLMRDPFAEQRELYRLHEWLLKRGFTAIITAKRDDHENTNSHINFLQFMVDCAVTLNHEVIEGVSQRNLRVLKFRGTSFSENESPFLIGANGLEVAGARDMGAVEVPNYPVSKERVSSGVTRLDAMLGGGYYRDASILITGFPGTAKSTLGGAFAEAACQRGESTLLVSFDSDANEVIRNLASVRIRLERFVKKGLLHIVSARAITGSSEIHLMRIKQIAEAQKTRCLVIDPVSALSKAGNKETAFSVAERLIDWTKSNGITLLCTSLLHEVGMQEAGTPLQISTIADTWIHLNYLVHAGERNRGISIIKSRGTSHSNQVRELVLSDNGVTLADVYTAGGEVLMGTLRYEKELAVRNALNEGQLASKLKKSTIETEEALLEGRLKAIQIELEMKRKEKQAITAANSDVKAELTGNQNHLLNLRGVGKK